ncbi:hypothetical protein GUITHDRAFT_133819 [Guillardia theta CCMP2712]|uniref:F5/8 type C domain-containing protein n=1 Tax=Guillardia theta (strain CCMP2712) TaxID=905079 RepID=L1JU33_GUITC|nr:hypothetical protein GUITHDRAFT_133819 [Guillardia theta CCMP2712]EKX52081.1 hypothetical protein GUITHDRAFT_133819 [Guillardia theta CCMP2712]|eukprot:XP_005839061.1 hypothetical protein GUITHDRAFT_133819 [Guillardia theta CCMP2712]
MPRLLAPPPPLLLLLVLHLGCCSCESVFPWDNASIAVQPCVLSKDWDLIIRQLSGSRPQSDQQLQTGGLGQLASRGSAAYGNGIYRVTSSGDYSDGTEYAWSAFDFISNSTTINFWTTYTHSYYSFSTGQYVRYPPTVTSTGISCAGEWLQISLPVSIYLYKYELYTRANNLFRGPKRFWILGSNDGSTWSVVDYQEGVTGYTSAGKSFVVEPTQKYSYYRIVVNENNKENWVSISWWKLWGAEIQGHETLLYPPAPLSAPTSTISSAAYGNGIYRVTSSGDYSDGTEYAWSAFDFISNSTTINFWTTYTHSYYSFSTGQYVRYPPTVTSTGISCAGEWLQISLPVSIYLYKYELYTRANNLFRGPKRFWILGSNDGSTWSVVDYQEGVTGYTRAGKSFVVEPTHKYSYYRIVVNENNKENWVSISWWKLWGVETAQDFLRLTRKRRAVEY